MYFGSAPTNLPMAADASSVSFKTSASVSSVSSTCEYLKPHFWTQHRHTRTNQHELPGSAAPSESAIQCPLYHGQHSFSLAFQAKGKAKGRSNLGVPPGLFRSSADRVTRHV